MKEILSIAYFFRKYGENSYTDITNYVSEHVSWNTTFSTELLEFSLTLRPNDLVPEEGDEIVVCRDKYKNQVLAGGLVGKIRRKSDPLLAWDYVNEKPIIAYSITCRQSDFSTDMAEIDIKTETSLQSILDIILLQRTGENLGGDDFPKYSVSFDASIYKIASFSHKGTALNALKSLLSQNNLYFRMYYYVQADTTNVLKVFPSVLISNSSGFVPKISTSWGSGITVKTIKTGKYEETRPGELVGPELKIGDSGFVRETNADDIKNYVSLYANIITNGLTESEFTASDDSGTVNLQCRATDIVYAAISVERDVAYSVSATLTKFYVRNKDDLYKDPYTNRSLLNVGDVIRFKDANGNIVARVTVTDFNYVDASVSYTPATEMQIISGTYRVVSNVPLYKDNNETLNIQTPSWCALYTASLKDNATVKFQGYAKPDMYKKVIISYYKLEESCQPRFDSESIKRYELMPYEEELEFPLTREQLEEVYRAVMQLKPTVKLKFQSLRTEPCEIGWKIPVDIPNYAQDLFTVQNVNCSIIKGLDKKTGRNLILQQIEISSANETLKDLLNRYNTKYNLKKPTTPESNVGVQAQKIKFKSSVDLTKSVEEIIPKTYELALMSYTKIYYRFQQGVGTTIVDSSGNGNNGTILYSSGTPYTWEAGLVGNDVSCLKLDGADNLPSSNACYIQMPYNASLIPKYKFTIRCLFQITDITKYSSLLNIYYPYGGAANYRVVRSCFWPKDSTTMTFIISIFENNNPYRVLTLSSDIPIQNYETKLLQFGIDFENNVYNLILNKISYIMNPVTNAFPSPYVNIADVSSFTGMINQQNAGAGCQLGIQLENYGTSKYNSIQARLIAFAFDVESMRLPTDATTDYNNFFD